MAETRKNIPIVPADLETFALPATFVNDFHLMVAGGNLRITFAEMAMNDTNRFRRVALVMPRGDALKLARAIIYGLHNVDAAGFPNEKLTTPPELEPES